MRTVVGRLTRLVGLVLASGFVFAGSAEAQAPYEGVWAGNAAQCRDEDGVDRMSIEGSLLSWYETRCRITGIKAEGRAAWSIRASCEGEGQRFSARPRITLAGSDQLVMTNSPVGPTRRQAYIRCRLP